MKKKSARTKGKGTPTTVAQSEPQSKPKSSSEIEPRFLQSLPKELVVMLLTHLDHSTISHFSLVSHQFYLWAQPILYRYIPSSVLPEKKLEKFDRCLRRNPSLYYHIQELELFFVSKEQKHEPALIARCKNLQHLSLLQCDPRMMAWNAIASKDLVSLRMMFCFYDSWLSLPQLMGNTFPRLQDLSLEFEEGLDGSLAEQAKSEGILPSTSLRHLHLYRVDLVDSDLMWFLRQCPRLSSLKIYPNLEENFLTSNGVRDAFDHASRFLKELSLRVPNTAYTHWGPDVSTEVLNSVFESQSSSYLNSKGTWIREKQQSICSLTVDHDFCDDSFFTRFGYQLQTLRLFTQLAPIRFSARRDEHLKIPEKMLSQLINARDVFPNLKHFTIQEPTSWMGKLWSEETKQTTRKLAEAAGISLVFRKSDH